MRVLTVGNLYPPHHQGGYELMWRSAVRHLRDRKDAVRVLTTDHREPVVDSRIAEDDDVHRELRWYWRDHRVPRLRLRERLRIERHNLAVLDRHLAEFEPDVVCWWAMGGLSLSLLERARGRGLAAAGVVIDEWIGYGPRIDGWQRAFDRPLIGRLAEAVTGIPTGVDIANAARWLFISKYVRGRAVAAGVPVGEAEIAYGGIDPARFAQRPEREWQGRLLCLGRIDPRKGVESAIEALALLDPSGYSLRVIGAGDPAHLARLRELARERGLGDRVSFERVAREAVADAYAEADALLFPVLWPEPFGLVPLEAMAVGTPVVATGTGGSGEYLADRENCLLFEPGDPASLAAAVRELERDAALRGRLRVGGIRTAGAHSEARFNGAVAQAIERAAS